MQKLSTNLFAGICIKRYPYLLKPLNKIEIDQDLVNKKFEYEKSVLSDFDMKKIKEDKFQKALMEASGEERDKLKMESEIITVKEKINEWEWNYRQINFDNLTNNHSNKLQILIVNQKLARQDNYEWFLPVFKFETKYNSLKQLVENNVNPNFNIKVSKLPSYCYKYMHNSELVKMFFLNAYIRRSSLIDDDVIKLNENILSTTWATLEELKDYVQKPKLLKIIHSFVKEC